MTPVTVSILLGLTPLVVAFLAAGVLARRLRPPPVGSPRLTLVLRIFVGGLAVQGMHAFEEAATGFPQRYPALLGLEPWPIAFFVFFNLGWLAIWLLALISAHRGHRLAWWPILFFALGMTLNGVGHPLLALVVGGYFPGLVTGPIAGLFGIWLLHALFGPDA